MLRNQNEAARLAAQAEELKDNTAEAMASDAQLVALCAKYFPNNFRNAVR